MEATIKRTLHGLLKMVVALLLVLGSVGNDPTVNRCSSELAAHEEIVTNLGNGHGMVYKPYEEWVGPTLRWAER